MSTAYGSLIGSLVQAAEKDKDRVLGFYLSNRAYQQDRRAAGEAAFANYFYNTLLQKQQYQYSLKTLQNQYVNARAGLEKAGYNPMLAVQNGVGMAGSISAPGVSSQKASAPDYVNALQTASNIKLQDSQSDVNGAQENLMNQQALTEEAKRTQMDFQNAMTDVETHLKQKDLSTYDRRFYTEMYEMMQRAEKSRQEASVIGYDAQSRRIAANAQVTASNAQKLGAEVVSDVTSYDKRRYIDWKKRHPIQEGFLYGLGQYTGALGKIFSGSAGVSVKK